MKLTEREKHWLLREAWTYLGHERPEEAFTILNYADRNFNNDIKIKKMLLVALLRTKAYEEMLKIADDLLQKTANKQEKYTIYLCKVDALFNLGREQDAEKNRQLFFMESNS